MHRGAYSKRAPNPKQQQQRGEYDVHRHCPPCVGSERRERHSIGVRRAGTFARGLACCMQWSTSHVARRTSLVAGYVLHIVCCTSHVVACCHVACCRFILHVVCCTLTSCRTLPRCAHSLRQVTSLEMNGLSFSLLAVRISAPQTRPERATDQRTRRRGRQWIRLPIIALRVPIIALRVPIIALRVSLSVP